MVLRQIHYVLRLQKDATCLCDYMFSSKLSPQTPTNLAKIETQLPGTLASIRHYFVACKIDHFNTRIATERK